MEKREPASALHLLFPLAMLLLLIPIAPVSADPQAPLLMAVPPSPGDSATFQVYATNPEPDWADRHEYYWVIEKDGQKTSYGPQSVQSDSSRHQSFMDFLCTPSVCAGAAITFTAYAYQGDIPSPSSGPLVIRPTSPPLDYMPEVKGFEPGGAQAVGELNSLHSTLIKADTPYSLTVGPPAGKLFDNYKFTLLDKNGAVLEALDSASWPHAITCTGCQPGDHLTAHISGQYKGGSSRELVLVFSIPRASTSASVAGICDSGAWLQRWLPLMGIAWAGLFAFIGFIYMMGTAFRVPQLTEWSKTEIGQALLGVGLLIVILWLMSLQCSLQIGEFAKWAGIGFGSSGFTVSGTGLQPSDTMMDAAIKGLQWSMQQTHLSIALIRYELGVLNIRATFVQSITEVPGIGGVGFTLSPSAGDWTMMGSMQMLLNLNTAFMLALLFQYFSLAIFSASSGLFLFLVPVGLILRCMPYLRGFGGALAAIGVGFYMLYPMYLALLGLMLPPIYATQPSAASLSGASSVDQLVGMERGVTGTSITSYFYSMPELPDTNNGILRATAVEDPASCGGPVFGLGRCFYTANIGPLFELTALNFLRAVLLPSAGLLVIISFVRDLSAIFGEEVEASKLVQMV